MRRPNLRRHSAPYSTLAAVVIATVGLSLAGVGHSGAQALEQHHPETPNKELTDKICAAIRADLQSYSMKIGASLKWCEILEITSATGDGANTVLADIGGVGASTDAIVVYRLNLGAVAAAKFKDRKGQVSEGGPFLRGASVKHSDSVTLSPSQHALFTMEVLDIKDDGSSGTCEVHAYEWISKFGMYVERASRKTDEVRCRQGKPKNR